MFRILFASLVVLGSAAVQAKDNPNLPTIGFTSSSPLSERAVTVESNGDRLTVVSKDSDGVAELDIEMRADTVVVTRRSELSRSQTVVDLTAADAWAKRNPADAATVMEHFNWIFSQHTRATVGTVVIEAGCGTQIQDLIDTADAMALACGYIPGGSIACSNATRAYRAARDALMRCFVKKN